MHIVQPSLLIPSGVNIIVAGSWKVEFASNSQVRFDRELLRRKRGLQVI